MCYTHRTGTSDIIFGYNGRDGVVTDTNGLCYMRARYYSPDMRRFINADIIAGKISNAVTLNRYAYANGNPVSNVDPFGLSSERENWYGAHADKKSTIVTADDYYDISLGLKLITLYHKQTLTAYKQSGIEGSWFDAYAYIDENLTEGFNSVGAGLTALYALGFDINVKFVGIEATLSLNTEHLSLYVNIDVDLLGNTTASVGFVKKLDGNVEINDQYGISGNTALVLTVVFFLVTGTEIDISSVRQPDPNTAPTYSYGY